MDGFLTPREFADLQKKVQASPRGAACPPPSTPTLKSVSSRCFELGVPKSLGLCSILSPLAAATLFLLSPWEVAISSEGRQRLLSCLPSQEGPRRPCFETAMHGGLSLEKTQENQQIPHIIQWVMLFLSVIVVECLETI